MEKNYWIMHMGRGNKFAQVSYKNNFVAVGWNELNKDLTEFQNLNRKDFADSIGPAMERTYKDKSANVRGSIIGQLFRFGNLMRIGDVVLVPHTQEGKVYVGTIDSDYFYLSEPDEACRFRRRRKVVWGDVTNISDISTGLRKILGYRQTILNASKYSQEIDGLLSNGEGIAYIESYEEFGLESQLEDFLVENWAKLSLGKKFNILKEDGEVTGQQYVTPIGRIDILAKSKDDKEWLVIELKKGRGADQVVGQVLRYIGWVQENEAQKNQKVSGLVIAKQSDPKLRYAMKTLNNVRFMTYSVRFELKKE